MQADKRKLARRAIPIVLLVLAAAAPYAFLVASRGIDFVYDDIRFISKNPSVTTPRGIFAYFTDPSTAEPDRWYGIWRPLRTIDFMLDWQIAGHDPPTGFTIRWFHLRNIGYHAISALLLFALLKRFSLPPLAAGLGAAVFALHPVQVESVAFVTSRGDLMCGALFLATLLVHSRCDGLSRRGAASAALLTLALLAKEAAVTFLPAAVLTDWLFRDGRSIRTTLARWRIYLVYGALTVAYVGAWLLVHRLNRGDIPGGAERWGGSLLGTLPVLGKSAVYYARLLLLPVDMALDFYIEAVRGFDPLGIACAVVLFVALLVSVRRLARRGSPGALAILWATLLLFPTSHIVVPVGIPTAERFLYLPMVGFSLWVGLLLFSMARRGPLGAGLVATVLACLFAVTAERAVIWRDPFILWGTTMARVRSPRAISCEANRLRVSGEERASRGEKEKGTREMLEALRLYDETIAIWRRMFPEGHGAVLTMRAERALNLYALGRYDEALTEAGEVLARWPDGTMAKYARALGLYGKGRLREAAVAVEEVLAAETTDERELAAAGIYEKLAEQMNREGNRARAFAALNRSWQLLPKPDVNRGVRAALDAMEKDYRRLVPPLEETVAADPANLEARVELASAYAAYGRYDRAGALFAPLLASPTNRTPDVLFPCALYFWQWRDTPEGYQRAADLYEEILRRDPGVAQAAEQLRICRERLAGR